MFASHIKQRRHFFVIVSTTLANFLATRFYVVHHGQRIGGDSLLLRHPGEQAFGTRQIFIQRFGGFLLFATPFHECIGGDIFWELPVTLIHQEHQPVFKFGDVFVVSPFCPQIADEIFQVFCQRLLSRIPHGFGWNQTMKLFFPLLHQLAQFFLGNLFVRYTQRDLRNPALPIHADFCRIQA